MCLPFWYPYGRYCYHVYNGQQGFSWPESRHYCQSIRGDLASLHSRAEVEFVRNLNYTKYHNIWIGLTRDSNCERRRIHFNVTSTCFACALTFFCFLEPSLFQLAGPGRTRRLWASSTGHRESPTQPSTPGAPLMRTAWRCTRTDSGTTTTACRREASCADTTSVRIHLLISAAGVAQFSTFNTFSASQTTRRMTTVIRFFPPPVLVAPTVSEPI